MATVEFEPFYRGDDYALHVTCKDNDGNIFDMTGWILRATMKLSTEDSDDATPAKVDVGPLSSDVGTTGETYLVFPSSQTTQLLPTRYYIDIQRQFNGVVTTLCSGRVRVLGDVTQRT